MGSMRDERLNRMWQGKKVRFLRPDEDDKDDDKGYFNIFTLHQNRDLGRGTKNCVKESMIPEWMDLVVWGHEHECLIEFSESVVGTFRITQPGSSVATSLVAGEAVRKKVGILDINGKNFRLHTIPLTNVRSFVTSEISLREHRSKLDPEDPKIDQKVADILDEEVRVMALNAQEKREEVLAEARAAGSDAMEKNCGIKYKLEGPDQVLVRIRVEHSGFSIINAQRFGAKFVGDVANPADLLLFHRRKDGTKGGGGTSTARHKTILQHPIVPDEIDRTNMEDMVMEHLEVPDQSMKLLDNKKFCETLEEFVEKSLADSMISETTKSYIVVQQNRLIKNMGNGDDDLEKGSAIREAIETQTAGEQENSTRKKRANSGGSVDQLENNGDAPAAKKPVSKGRTKSTKSSFMPPVDEDDDDDSFGEPTPSDKAASKNVSKSRSRLLEVDSDDEPMEVEPPAKGKKATRPSRFGVNNRTTYNDESDEVEVIESDDDDEDVGRPKKKAMGTRQQATHSQTSMAGTARKRKTAIVRPSRMQDSDDEEEFGGGGTNEMEEDWGSFATRSQL
jgi:double-strand break repair protein MRE11